MKQKIIAMGRAKKIALVAHDHKKQDLVDWARFNQGTLSRHQLFSTGTTGRLIEEELGLPVSRLLSGPLGGDQQIGSMIAAGEIDFLIFFWDPLSPMPHDPDVKALLRLAVVWNIPVACSWATADFMISSSLMDTDYERIVPDYDDYLARPIPGESHLAAPAPKEAPPRKAAPESEKE